jgi:hypothetical protein
MQKRTPFWIPAYAGMTDFGGAKESLGLFRSNHT